MMVLKLSIPVIFIDEVLKFVARTYLDGKLNMQHVVNMLCVQIFSILIFLEHKLLRKSLSLG